MIAFEGAERALEVLLDLGAVAEEVFVDEVVGVVGADLEHAEGEAFVGVGGGLGIFGLFEALFELGLIDGVKPGAFGFGEALGDPGAVDEALDEDLLGGVLGLEVV